MSKILQIVLILTVFSCGKTDDNLIVTESRSYPFYVNGSQILKMDLPIHYDGVNSLDVFGITDRELMSAWSIEINRVFIGNLREQPINGNAIQDSKGSWLHPLQSIVDENRSVGIITILCPFGWVNEAGEQTMFTGLNPSSQGFYALYKARMRTIAEHFKDQKDVWIEVWNEPYNWQNGNGYSHELWLNDMMDMVANLRSISGFDNVILVPGNEQGQSEEAILMRGDALISAHSNIVFDLHAYEKWLIGVSQAQVQTRIDEILKSGFAVVFGEVGVINESGLMQVEDFLEVVNKRQISTLAWVWKFDGTDPNALLSSEILPNNNSNNDWGNTFRDFLD